MTDKHADLSAAATACACCSSADCCSVQCACTRKASSALLQLLSRAAPRWSNTFLLQCLQSRKVFSVCTPDVPDNNSLEINEVQFTIALPTTSYKAAACQEHACEKHLGHIMTEQNMLRVKDAPASTMQPASSCIVNDKALLQPVLH